MLLAGCDRNDAPTPSAPAPTPAPFSVTGYAVNGPLDGATVRIFGADGALLGTTTTSHDGAYLLQVTVPPPYRIEVVGGRLEGQPYEGVLRAPCEAAADCNITPFTTVIARLIDEHGYNAGDAKAQLAQQLNFDYDPFIRSLIEAMPVEEFDLERARTYLDGGDALDEWVDEMLDWVDQPAAGETPPAGIRYRYTITANAGEGGTITPAFTEVDVHGSTLSLSLAPNAGYRLDAVTGCGGSLDGLNYTTGPITSSCSINAHFTRIAHTVAAIAGEGGEISPASRQVAHGDASSFTLEPAAGYELDTVSGCDGRLDGNTYTTAGITAACTVTASFSRQQYTISASAGAGGAISPVTQRVPHGTSALLTLAAESGYAIAGVTGCAGTLNGNRFTTEPLTADCHVNAAFALLSYPVSATASEGGSISPANSNVTHGTLAVFTLLADTGYEIDTATGCSGTLSGSIYTTGVVTSACAVNATFRLKHYAVTASAGEGGTISPTIQNVTHGETASFTLDAETGYELDAISGCDGALTGNTYTTSAITNTCAVTASFSLKQHAVSASASEGGSITPTTQNVTHGETASFTLNAETGYELDTISGCDGALTGNTYTTSAITNTCAVTASFSLKQYAVSASANEGGSITPTTQNVTHGETASFTVTPTSGYELTTISGCGGSLDGNTYTTAAITSECAVSASFALSLAAPTLSATAGTGAVTVSWSPVTGADGYDLYYAEESFDPANYNSYAGGTLMPNVSSPQTVSGLNDGIEYFFSAAAKAGSTRRFSPLVSATPTTACFGISANDPQVCSGNGSCPATDTCECEAGFIGKQCNVDLKFSDDSREHYFPTTTGKYSIIDGPDLPAGETYVWKFEILADGFWPQQEGFTFGVAGYPLYQTNFHELGQFTDEWAYRGRNGRTYAEGVTLNFGDVLRTVGDQIMLELDTVSGVLSIYTKRLGESEFTLEGGRSALTGVFPKDGRVLRPAVSGICWQPCGIRFIE